MQTGVTVANGAITGTLSFIEGGLAASGPLAGDGNFLALQWSDPAADVTSLKVGLDPSQGTGLVECLDDTDRNGVFKITSTSQVFKVVQKVGTTEHTQEFDLSGLTLLDS